MRYRTEIDGLRAVAVIPVIFYHAGFSLFGGGFVGVDVFFVISGYLITTIILDDLERGTFSILNFYERRARRILPALFFVLGASTCLAWFFYSNDDLLSFSRSLAGVTVFSSNLVFWKESGYFDTVGELKPLLHTWSLAVEEQYYLIFPVCLILAWRLGRRWILILMLLLGVVSLGLAQWAAAAHPTAAFYLLPTRGWEILIGAGVAMYLSRRELGTPDRTLSEVSVWTGSLLLAFSIFAFNKRTPFPSLYTLAPTLGTALIILFATQNTTIGRLLGNKLFVGVGLVSYSAYLWHQPLFAFIRYRSLNEPTASLLIALAGVSVAFAYLSWRHVEKPFRNKQTCSRKQIFLFGAIGAVVFLSAGLLGYVKVSNAEKKAHLSVSSYSGPSRVLLLGDSHALHLAYGLEKQLGRLISSRSFPGCIPFYNVDRYDSRFDPPPGECAKTMNKELAAFERDGQLRTIILSTMGPVYLDGTPFKGKNSARVTGMHVGLIDDPTLTDRWQVFEIGMRRTLARLTSLPDKRVIFALDVPELGIESRLCGVPQHIVTVLGTKFGAGEISYADCFVSRQDFDERVQRYHRLVKTVLSDFPAVILFDPTGYLCDDKKCYGVINNNKLYTDADHLSDFGSDYIAKRLAPVVLDSLR